jgi:hypothetical protein
MFLQPTVRSPNVQKLTQKSAKHISHFSFNAGLTKFIVWPLDGSADVPDIDPRGAETRWPIPHPTPAPTCCCTNKYNITSRVIGKMKYQQLQL